jgi:hypothetical protein
MLFLSQSVSIFGLFRAFKTVPWKNALIVAKDFASNLSLEKRVVPEEVTQVKKAP